MKKSSRPASEKQKDRDRLIALTKDGYSAWSFDGETLPDHVCRYILGIYYEIDFDHHRIYLEYYRHGELIDSKIIVLYYKRLRLLILHGNMRIAYPS